MLRVSRLRGVPLHHRRRWEQRLTSALSDHREGHIDAAAQRFRRIYRDRHYTPVTEAFPLLDQARWAGLPDPADDPDPAPAERPGSAGPTPADVPAEPAATAVLHATFLGPPNAGKTSLVNALALSPVGAVSPRRDTTKDWTKAVATVHGTQLLLLDTPGVEHGGGGKGPPRGRRAPGTAKAWDSIYHADLVVLVLGAGLGFVEPAQKQIAREVVQRAGARELPVVLALTMLDRVQTARQRELYFAMRADLEGMGLPLARTHEVSVKAGRGLVELKDTLCRYAVPGPWPHARRECTDLSPVDRVAEFLRQAYFEFLPHEIPHEMRQRIIGWTRKDSGTTEVVVEVFFDRPAYMFTFYAKLEVIAVRVQQLAEGEFGARYRFVFQAFTSPGGLSNR